MSTLAPKSESADAPSAQKPITESQLVKVTIATSRPEVTGNAAYGIFADLQNVSSASVKLYPGDVTMVMQPEVAGDPNCVFSQVAYFPTEPSISEKVPEGGPIIIRPKEIYAVFWNVSKPSTANCQTQPDSSGEKPSATMAKTHWWETIQSLIGKVANDQLSFVPGDYVFIVDGKAHWMPDGAEESGYHTFTDRVKIHVGLSQIDTMFAAMIGGVIGYFVMALRQGGDLGKFRLAPSADRKTRLVRFLVIIRNLLSAALVSAVVTIILSRISDTQFPIKVSVNDFWGALTVGFVAYFVGNNIIDRIVGIASNGKDNGMKPLNQPAASTAVSNQGSAPSASVKP